jgi:hypothetical protein
MVSASSLSLTTKNTSFSLKNIQAVRSTEEAGRKETFRIKGLALFLV